MVAEFDAAGLKLHAYVGDLADMASAETVTQLILAEHGAVDVLINNAGRSIRRAIENSFERFHDFGKLLLAFLMLWAYFALSQFLIIWSANLPEETPWYLTRREGGWPSGLVLALTRRALAWLEVAGRIDRNAPRPRMARAGHDEKGESWCHARPDPTSSRSGDERSRSSRRRQTSALVGSKRKRAMPDPASKRSDGTAGLIAARLRAGPVA